MGIKSKILLSVVSVFLMIYGLTLYMVYVQARDQMLNAIMEESISITKIISSTLYRNFEIANDAREIQSYIAGIATHKKNLTEISVIDPYFVIVSSTSEKSIFEMVHDRLVQRALANKPEIQNKITYVKNKPSVVIALPISAGPDENFRSVGAIKITIDIQNELKNLRAIRNKILISGFIILVSLIVIVIWLSHSITEPIKKLYKGIQKVDQGDFSIQVQQTSKDEVGYLTYAFNAMISSMDGSRKELSKKAEELTVLNGRLEQYNIAVSKFVPYQFLELLGHKDIINISVGDSFKKELTVLFLDIRGFTAFAETMDSSKILMLLNKLVQRLLPCIQRNNGFVDKYIGDAIMAIFPNSPEDGIEAALEMLKAVEQFNLVEGMGVIKVGIGINTGDVIIGTIGSESRMNTTVIGNTVNIASRLEAVSKELNVPIVISHLIYDRLSDDFKCKITIKNLGKSQLKGMTQLHTIYEVAS